MSRGKYIFWCPVCLKRVPSSRCRTSPSIAHPLALITMQPLTISARLRHVALPGRHLDTESGDILGAAQ